MAILQHILEAYTHFRLAAEATPIGQGNIHDTYLVRNASGKRYILQRINTAIFKDVDALTSNQQAIQAHLSEQDYPLCMPRLLPNDWGAFFTKNEDGSVWRLVHFCEAKYSKLRFSEDFRGKAATAFKTAYAFGLFDALLLDMPKNHLHETIRDFHNTPVRWSAFEAVIQADVLGRVGTARAEIAALHAWKPCFEVVFELMASNALAVQVVHNDAKVDNVVFAHQSTEPIAIIDWDTVMEGCILTDIGDLVRSMAPNYDEHHADIAALKMDSEVIAAIYTGFHSAFLEKGHQNTADAIAQYAKLAAPWIIGEQALRFLTDYLQGDIYYKTSYAKQNLTRARNQLRLLELLDKMEL